MNYKSNSYAGSFLWNLWLCHLSSAPVAVWMAPEMQYLRARDPLPNHRRRARHLLRAVAPERLTRIGNRHYQLGSEIQTRISHKKYSSTGPRWELMLFFLAELRKSHPLHIGKIYQWLHSSEVENWHFLSRITQATKVFLPLSFWRVQWCLSVTHALNGISTEWRTCWVTSTKWTFIDKFPTSWTAKP